MASIAAYTTTYNCFEMNYPFRECIAALLGFADEIVVVDTASNDGTLEELQRLERSEKRIRVFVEPVDFSHPRWAIHMDGYQKAKARAQCQSEYCWQIDTDEIVLAHDFSRIRMLPEVLGQFMKERPVIFMPMVEFWGSFEKIRADFLSWKPRFSVNHPNITHGIPLEYRMVDKWGNEYPRPFESDSCNYIWKDSHKSVEQLLPVKIDGVLDSADAFDRFFSDALQRFPSVLHLSWLNLERKLEHYRRFWPRFHTSMYNLGEVEDPKKNVMFEKPWSQVTDLEITEKVKELIRRGPYFFGAKNTRKETAPTIPYRGPIPESIRPWGPS